MAARPTLAVGGALALLSATFFGVSTPLIQRFGRGLGAFTTAALIYGGVAIAMLVRLDRNSRPSLLTKDQLKRVAFVALLGAVIAPSLLAWGLQHASGTVASLMLNTEAVFTVLFARIVHREHVGRRVTVALWLMVVGGALVVFDDGETSRGANGWGALAVVGASIAWATDNTLMRPLADLDSRPVIFMKGLLGASLSLAIATLTDRQLPTVANALAISICGALGYGASLWLYLLAQRRIGAGRTASIFAVGPFLGAIGAWLLGDRSAGMFTLIAASLFATGTILHMTERHRHRHRHPAVTHDHPHRHDDGHHDHAHSEPVQGEHSHVHSHDEVVHDHEHGFDTDHSHEH